MDTEVVEDAHHEKDSKVSGKVKEKVHIVSEESIGPDGKPQGFVKKDITRETETNTKQTLGEKVKDKVDSAAKTIGIIKD